MSSPARCSRANSASDGSDRRSAGLRARLSGCLGIEPTAIAADEFDPGILLQLVRGPLRGAGLQNVRYRAPLEIDDNSSVSEAFAPAPVVDRNGAQRFGFTMFPDMALQLPQDGVVADRHSQARQQPFADPAAGGMAEQSNEFANSPCFPGGRQRDHQRFGECLSSTTARCDISSGQSESPAS